MKLKYVASSFFLAALTFLHAASAGAAVLSLNGQTGMVQTFSNDTNIRIASASNVHTLGWDGILTVSRGGTGASVFTQHGIVYGNGTGYLQASSAGTAGQFLQADASGVPGFVTLSGDATIGTGGVLTISNDSVTLGSDTIGSYVSIISGSGQISVTGSGSESAAVSLAVATDSIGATDLDVIDDSIPTDEQCLTYESGGTNGSLEWQPCSGGTDNELHAYGGNDQDLGIFIDDAQGLIRTYLQSIEALVTYIVTTTSVGPPQLSIFSQRVYFSGANCSGSAVIDQGARAANSALGKSHNPNKLFVGTPTLIGSDIEAQSSSYEGSCMNYSLGSYPTIVNGFQVAEVNSPFLQALVGPVVVE